MVISYKINKNSSLGFLLVIDNIEFEESKANITKSPKFDHYTLEVFDKKIFEKILECKNKDFKNTTNLIFYGSERWKFFDLTPSFNFKRNNNFLEISVDFDLRDWEIGFGYTDFATEFSEIASHYDNFTINFLGAEDNENEQIRIEIESQFESAEEKLKENLEKTKKMFFYLYEKTLINLRTRNNKNLLILPFEFPNELKIPCEQYLQYFAQFLQDLGINATSNLKEEAGKVLFSVTPTDETQALDKIREALAIYLKLPESPIIFDDSFKSMRLQQQIENLQHSQRMAVRELQFNEKLLIAQSDTIHEKNITISQQQYVIENQNKIIEKISSKSVMTDSLENKEKLYEGLEFVPSEALKKYAGVIFQPMSFFKELGKNILGKDEFTFLDLDKEAEK